jgi:hypothetical protein
LKLARTKRLKHCGCSTEVPPRRLHRSLLAMHAPPPPLPAFLRLSAALQQRLGARRDRSPPTPPSSPLPQQDPPTPTPTLLCLVVLAMLNETRMKRCRVQGWGEGGGVWDRAPTRLGWIQLDDRVPAFLRNPPRADRKWPKGGWVGNFEKCVHPAQPGPGGVGC